MHKFLEHIEERFGLYEGRHVPLEQPMVEEAQPEKKEEELEEYSASVKRRIDKLTRKMREAERREQAAIEYAKKAQEKLKTAESQGIAKDKRTIEEGTQRIKTQESLLSSLQYPFILLSAESGKPVLSETLSILLIYIGKAW